MKIVYLKTFLKDIKKIKDPKLALKVEQLILEIKSVDSLEDLKNVKKMKGYSIAYRIRIGDYRMGIYKESDYVEIARFLKRSDIYKVFPK
ncbi:hypothetical protein MTsPCn5_17090 [Croceitalea sp. MTPC5]|uniref:Type II toxin-antitoxin system RelE/ParE family toxin n=1 Tax=Croceitalea marina TaxID=1775166 RepID=A0ABW5MY89_9FLAO|nr:hypothetical protein MTsPCn5_17090 [Croceitalea sp. MTPC5]